MAYARCILVVLASLLTAELAGAQQARLVGHVYDAETGEPLVQANVVLPGANVGTATDYEGRYTLALDPGTYEVEVRFLGYVTQSFDLTLRADETLTRDVMLEPDLTGLEEVVVSGVASRTSRLRSEVAVSRIDAADLVEEVPYQDVASLLSGKVTGVTVQPATGNVAGGIRFIVRGGGGLNGDGQPVVYVDGVRISTEEVKEAFLGGQGQGLLADLSPDNIERIDVLKGPAAAALYGTSGSNGVVLITTKQGRFAGSGTGFSARYKGTFGYNTNQADYSERNFATAPDANTLFREGGITGHAVEVSGGTPTVSFFAGYARRDEAGILFPNAMERNNLKASLRVIPSENVDIDVNATYVLNKVNHLFNDNNIVGFLNNTLATSPELGPYPLADSLSIVNIGNETRSNRFIGSGRIEVRPLSGLALEASIGIDAVDFRHDLTASPRFPLLILPEGGRESHVREDDNVNAQGVVSYAFAPAPRLESRTAVGFQVFDERERTFAAANSGLPSGLITDIGAAAELEFLGETFLNTRELGVFAEQQLGYDDTYFLTLGLRREYASTIGIEAPSVYYPRVSAAFRVDQVVDVPVLDLLKLRAAYGESGQLPLPTDAVRFLYEAEAGGYGPGGVLDQIGNLGIEPERVREFEIGLDTELLGGRVGLEATYYDQDAEDSIIDFLNAPSTGLTASAVPFNIGAISGRGVELALRATPYRSRGFQVDLSVLYNYATNEVQELGEVNGVDAQPIFGGYNVNVIEAGLPRSAFYVLPVLGPRFNEDGTYAGVELGDERVYRGTPYPDHFGSISLNARLFRDLNVYALVDWQTGLSLFNFTQARVSQNRFGLPDNNPRRDELADRLGLPLASGDELPDLEPGSEAYVEAATEYAFLDGRFEDNYIERADFLKLRELSLSYDFSRLINDVATLTGRVRTVRLTLSGRNLWMSSRYSGPDPEINSAGARSINRGIDFFTLQPPRQFYATVTLGF